MRKLFLIVPVAMLLIWAVPAAAQEKGFSPPESNTPADSLPGNAPPTGSPANPGPPTEPVTSREEVELLAREQALEMRERAILEHERKLNDQPVKVDLDWSLVGLQLSLLGIIIVLGSIAYGVNRKFS